MIILRRIEKNDFLKSYYIFEVYDEVSYRYYHDHADCTGYYRDIKQRRVKLYYEYGCSNVVFHFRSCVFKSRGDAVNALRDYVYSYQDIDLFNVNFTNDRFYYVFNQDINKTIDILKSNYTDFALWGYYPLVYLAIYTITCGVAPSDGDFCFYFSVSAEAYRFSFKSKTYFISYDDILCDCDILGFNTNEQLNKIKRILGG